MTEVDTDKLRALDEAATPGEWIAGDGCVHASAGEKIQIADIWSNRLEDDASLIAYLRNSIPAILAMAEENARMRKGLEKIEGGKGFNFQYARSYDHCRDIARRALGKVET